MASDSRSAAFLEAEVTRLELSLASALQQLSETKAENFRLRKLLLPSPASLSRKRIRDEASATTQGKRLRPLLYSASQTTPMTTSSKLDSVCRFPSEKSKVAGKASTSKETLQRKAETRRKKMTALVRDFSENCRPVYSEHLAKEREDKCKSVEQDSRHKFRLLR